MRGAGDGRRPGRGAGAGGRSFGDEGVVSHAYDGGRRLPVEIGREDGTSAGFVDLKVGEDGSLGVVGYTTLSNRR